MPFLRDWFNEGGCVIKVYIHEWDSSFTNLQKFALALTSRYFVLIHSTD
jgi:hypothetical protein